MNNTLGQSSVLTSMGSNQSANNMGTNIFPTDSEDENSYAQTAEKYAGMANAMRNIQAPPNAQTNSINALANMGISGSQDMSNPANIQAPAKQKNNMDIGSMLSMAKSGGMGAGTSGAASASGGLGAGAELGTSASFGSALAALSDKTSKAEIKKISTENNVLKNQNKELQKEVFQNPYAANDPLNNILPTWDTSQPIVPTKKAARPVAVVAAPRPKAQPMIQSKPVVIAAPPPPPMVVEYGNYSPKTIQQAPYRSEQEFQIIPSETGANAGSAPQQWYSPAPNQPAMVSTVPSPFLMPNEREQLNYTPYNPSENVSSDERIKEGFHHAAFQKHDSPSHRLDGSEVQEFLDGIKPYSFKYKDPKDGSPTAPVDDRYLGVMAQDVEKTPTGNTIVKENAEGKKYLEIGPMMSALAASTAYMNDRVKALEDHAMKKKG